MSDPEKPEQAPEDIPSSGPSVPAKRRRSLSKSRRELTEEELGQSGVRLMLLDEVDRLDAEVVRLQDFQDRFHTSDKQLALMQDKRRRDVVADVVYGVCLALGVGLLMLAPTVPEEQKVWPWVAVGIILVLCGIAMKVIRR
jgi:hypothetical protein